MRAFDKKFVTGWIDIHDHAFHSYIMSYFDHFAYYSTLVIFI